MFNNRNWSTTLTVLSMVMVLAVLAVFIAAQGGLGETPIAVIRWSRVMMP